MPPPITHIPIHMCFYFIRFEVVVAADSWRFVKLILRADISHESNNEYEAWDVRREYLFVGECCDKTIMK